MNFLSSPGLRVTFFSVTRNESRQHHLSNLCKFMGVPHIHLRVMAFACPSLKPS